MGALGIFDYILYLIDSGEAKKQKKEKPKAKQVNVFIYLCVIPRTTQLGCNECENMLRK